MEQPTLSGGSATPQWSFHAFAIFPCDALAALGRVYSPANDCQPLPDSSGSPEQRFGEQQQILPAVQSD
jgi:hypothetical protein